MERNTPPDPAPSSIFHYTGRETAKSILRSGSLWFTDCQYLNDRKEVLAGLHAAEKLLIGKSNNKPSDAFRRNLRSRLAGAVQDTFGFFVASFSLSPDNQHLWENYAGDSHGAVIEIHAKTIDEAMVLPRRWLLQSFPIRYDHNQLSRMQTEAVKQALAVVDSYDLREEEKPIVDEFVQLMSTHSSLLILFNALLFKSSKWRPEQEFRALILGEFNKLLGHPHCSSRPTPRGQAPYISLPLFLPIDADRGVKSILLGRNASDDSVEDLRKHLIDNGYCNVNVLRHARLG
jgi:hypothetical protein